MSDFTTTPNLGLFKPTYDADAEMWGTHLNANADVLDAKLGPSSFLPLAGGTMLGPLVLSGDPTGSSNVNQAATKHYVDAAISGAGTFVDAPSDTFSYGRLNGAWTRVLPLAGGTITGDTTINTHLNVGTSSSVVSGAIWNPLLYLNTGLSGSTTASSGTDLFRFVVNADSLNTSGSGGKLVNYMGLYANFGGATMTGNRQGLNLQVGLTAPSGNPRGGSYVGIVGTAAAVASDNGTGLTTQTLGGSLYGAGFYAYTAGSAKNFGLVCGAEFNPAIGSGTTATQLVGLQIVPTSAHQVRGAWHNDTGCLVVGQVSAVALDVGYACGSSQGGWPVQSSGAIFRAQISAGASAVAQHGVALHEASFPAFTASGGALGGALVSNGFAVDGVGAIRCGTAYLTPGSSGVSLDAHGSIGTGTPTIATAGTGYSVGDVLYDPYGGIYTVSSTGSGGAVLAIAAYVGSNGETHYPIFPSATTPVNPVPTAVWVIRSGIASGCTLNLTWDTSRTALSIQPSGGSVMVNAGCTITSGSAAPAATQPAGSIYMRTGGASGARLYVSAGAGAWNPIAGV